MLNYIWFGMIVISFGVGIINGRIEAVTQAVMDSSKGAVELCIALLGVMCLWTGLMNIAEKSGLVRLIAKLVNPLLNFLFPELPKTHPARGSIVMNLVANFLGLGNAATPLGIKAMAEMQKLNRNKDTASNSMCMFLVLNASVLQLIPAMVIAIRAAEGSSNPGEVIVTIWIATLCASITGITAAKVFEAMSGSGKSGSSLRTSTIRQIHTGGKRKKAG